MLEEIQLDIHHKILILLYFISYFAAMMIQIKDPNTKVEASDWILAFLTSLMGAVIAYFGVMQWANLGLRMAVTILISLVSYRTMKFIVSDEAQNDFAKGFVEGLMNLMRRLFNSQPNNDNNSNNNGRS